MTGLSVRGLTLARPGSRGAAPVVHHVSFSAPGGDVTAVLGGAGAGKTLLLAGVAGLAKAESGAVLVDGVDVSARRAARRGIGMLPPGTDLGAGRTLAASLRAVAGGGRAPEVAALLPLLGLDGLAARKVRELSHGQGFAALTAARLLAQGAVLLVDEAGEGLDDAAREAVCRWLRVAASAGRTLVFATRQAATAMQAAHLVLLHRGAVLQTGPPREIYHAPRDLVAARLTGPANILEGTVRQKVPGGFVWAAGGGQFRQHEAVCAPVPPLAGQVVFCLRPEALHLTSAGAPASDGATLNRLGGTVLDPAVPGGCTALVDTNLGPLLVGPPGPHGLHAGQAVELAWAPDAAHVLAPIVA
jgi:ABC-type Fe3+/spermidine/putrescine transport system ATPase subunit